MSRATQLLTAFKTNLAVLWTVARVEVHIDLRLLRTWIFVAFALLVGVTNAIEQVGVYAQLSAVSSGTFMHSPLLAPMTIFPDFQVIITFGLIFFAIEIVSRDRQARIDEVIAALPISNNQLVFGRALGLSVLLFLLFAAFLCLYVLVGFVCELVLPNLGFRSPEMFSMLATLVMDALPYMYFWTAAVMFLTVLVRLRVIAIAVAMVFMLLMYWLQNNAPMYLIDTLGTYSLNPQLPSELAPTFASSAILIHRVALVLLATAFLLWTASLLPRLDTVRTRKPVVYAASVTLLAVIGFSFVHHQTTTQLDVRDGWVEFHAQYRDVSQLDMRNLSGQVVLEPGSDVAIDLTLEFKLVQAMNEGDALVFSLNPAYEIEAISFGDEPLTYSFEAGLLEVNVSRSLMDGERLSLAIRARGSPNVGFAYLDSALDPLTSSAVSAYGLLLLGSKPAINHADYVALTPAIAWYPMAGSHVNRDASSVRPRDFFSVNLDVLVPSEWHVVGPGKPTVEALAETRLHTFTPQIPIHEVGLFAAVFERREKTIAGIDFELLVSPEHTRNLDLFEPILDEIETDVAEHIQFARERGFEYPFDTYTIVETPIYLRTFGGGWQMPSTQSLPGVFLLREGTFLAAEFLSIVTNLHQDTGSSETEKHQRLLEYLRRYFRNDVMGGNVSDAFIDNLVGFQAAPSGPGAERLGFLIDYLTNNVIAESIGFYSVQNLKSVGTLATARLGAWDIEVNRRDATLNQIYFNQYINRPEVWEFMLDGSNHEDRASLNPRYRLHASYLYSKTMGDLLIDWFGPQKIASLLTTLATRFRGKTFTYDEFNEVASELDMPLRERLGDLLRDIRPAGFVASTYTTDRLPDRSDGFPVYEHTLHVQNREPHPGMLSVRYEFSSEVRAGEHIHIHRSTRPIRLNGDSSVQISIQTQSPIEAMQIHPYFSLNRMDFSVDFVGGPAIPTVSRVPAPVVQPSDWQWKFSDTIYVDDLDPGFSVDSPETKDDSRFTVRMITLNQTDPELVSTDGGLEVYGGYGTDNESGWTRQGLSPAFGAYRRTLVRAEHESTPLRAHFKADLPHKGTWNLHYHLPDVGERNNNVFETRGQYGLDSGEENTWGDFDISVTQSGKIQTVEFRGGEMSAGWNRIGSLELDGGEVIVSVSTQTSSGTVVADAIYWEQSAS